MLPIGGGGGGNVTAVPHSPEGSQPFPAWAVGPSHLSSCPPFCLLLHPFQYPHFTVTQPQVIPRLNPPSSLQHLQAFLAQTLSVLLPSLADTEPVAFPPISHAVNAAVCSVAQGLLN